MKSTMPLPSRSKRGSVLSEGVYEKEEVEEVDGAAVVEVGRFVYVRDVHNDRDGVSITVAVEDSDSHHILVLCFIVEWRLGFQLSRAAINGKRCGIGATEGIEQGITIWIRG